MNDKVLNLLLVAGFGLFAGPAAASTIIVQNPSFDEINVTSPGQFDLNCPDNWTCTGQNTGGTGFSGGVFYPVGGSHYIVGSNGLSGGRVVPDGNTVGFTPDTGGTNFGDNQLSQTSLATIQSNTTYTLGVWAGRRHDSPYGDVWPSAKIQLWANEVAIATLMLDPLTTTQGSWREYFVSYTTGASDPLAGQRLGVALIEGEPVSSPVSRNSDHQVNWDAVTLTQDVPEPGTLLLLAMGFGSLALARRKSKVQV